MGIISTRAKKAFLDRQRHDYRSYKSLTDAQLDQRMLALPVQPPIWYKLEKHQKACFLIGAKGRFLWLLDPGMGKTLLTIALARYFRLLGKIKQVLVLVPNRINKDEWAAELYKHSPKSSYLILKGSSIEKRQALETSNALFVIETYAGFSRLTCEKQARKKGKGQRLVPNPKLIAWMRTKFQGVIADECTYLANHTALPFRICRQLSKGAEIFFPMTGTPFNRDPTMLWAQMYLVDHGETLGETLGLFRSIFCKEKINFFTGMPEYHFDHSKEALLNKFIANKSIAYEADAASLPGVVQVSKYVSLPGDAQSYYDKAREQLIAAQGSFVGTKNAFIRMRQISSGFVGYEDDETGDRAQFAFPDNPKLDLLLSIIESIREEYKIIVFYDFTYSGERIFQALKDMKRKALLLYGKTKDVQKVRDQFINDPKKQILVLQNKFGIGLNLQVAKYSFFYESPVSAIVRKQCERRMVRQHSQNKTVFLYDLIMKGTVDEDVLSFHKDGRDLFEAIVRGEGKKL